MISYLVSRPLLIRGWFTLRHSLCPLQTSLTLPIEKAVDMICAPARAHTFRPLLFCAKTDDGDAPKSCTSFINFSNVRVCPYTLIIQWEVYFLFWVRLLPGESAGDITRRGLIFRRSGSRYRGGCRCARCSMLCSSAGALPGTAALSAVCLCTRSARREILTGALPLLPFSRSAPSLLFPLSYMWDGAARRSFPPILTRCRCFARHQPPPLPPCVTTLHRESRNRKFLRVNRVTMSNEIRASIHSSNLLQILTRLYDKNIFSWQR